MSQVPTWVKAKDGQFYQDPVLRGEDWFLCFDDDDPPELVMKADRLIPESKADVKERAKGILDRLGVRYELCGGVSRSSRCFGSQITRMHPAVAVFLHIKDPIPVPFEFSKVTTRREDFGECVFYAFE